MTRKESGCLTTVGNAAKTVECAATNMPRRVATHP
jgi:hypothetical protein